MSNHLMQREYKRRSIPMLRKKGAKTFKTEEAAKSYAETNKIKKFSIRNLKLDPRVKPKFKIIVEN